MTLPDYLEQRIERIPLSGCWIWTGVIANTGYGRITRKGGQWQAHRLVYAAVFGEPGDRYVCHRCDVRCCVNPAHLFLGDHDSNMRDMAQKHRKAGEKNPHAKLTNSQAIEIRHSPLPTSHLVARYGVDKSTIRNIRSGRRWGGVV